MKFYIFLEEVYERALLKKQINESCKQSSQIKVCSKCKRTGHLADKCYEGKVLTTVSEVENCPICDDDLHSIEIKVSNGAIKQVKGNKLFSCPKYNQGSDEEKRAIYLRIKDNLTSFANIVPPGGMIPLVANPKIMSSVKHVIIIILKALVHCKIWLVALVWD